LKAGIDATLLYFRLGQLMELELDIPIWWMYLSFPVGFAIMTLFSIELLLDVLIKNDVEKKDTY
jgi:TRAP-type C4-dicarboxylate transport system permease small subunit